MSADIEDGDINSRGQVWKNNGWHEVETPEHKETWDCRNEACPRGSIFPNRNRCPNCHWTRYGDPVDETAASKELSEAIEVIESLHTELGEKEIIIEALIDKIRGQG